MIGFLAGGIRLGHAVLNTHRGPAFVFDVYPVLVGNVPVPVVPDDAVVNNGGRVVVVYTGPFHFRIRIRLTEQEVLRHGHVGEFRVGTHNIVHSGTHDVFAPVGVQTGVYPVVVDDHVDQGGAGKGVVYARPEMRGPVRVNHHVP